MIWARPGLDQVIEKRHENDDQIRTPGSFININGSPYHISCENIKYPKIKHWKISSNCRKQKSRKNARKSSASAFAVREQNLRSLFLEKCGRIIQVPRVRMKMLLASQMLILWWLSNCAESTRAVLRSIA